MNYKIQRQWNAEKAGFGRIDADYCQQQKFHELNQNRKQNPRESAASVRIRVPLQFGFSVFEFKFGIYTIHPTEEAVHEQEDGHH